MQEIIANIFQKVEDKGNGNNTKKKTKKIDGNRKEEVVDGMRRNVYTLSVKKKTRREIEINEFTELQAKPALL